MLFAFISIETGETLRSHSTVAGKTSKTWSNSSLVVRQPSENLIELWANSYGFPNAKITCDGSSDSDVHAEPVEKEIPFASKYNTSASPSISRIETFTLFGRRFVGWPLSTVLGMRF